jgi:hypothetical protein
MYLTYFNYTFLSLDFSLINTFNYKNAFLKISLNKLELNFSIRNTDNLNSVFFPKTLWLLEDIGFKKSVSLKVKAKRTGRNERRVFFSSVNTLRASDYLSFVYFYFSFCVVPIWQKYVYVNRKLDFFSSHYNFSIKNITVFPGLLENFYKWEYPIFMNLSLKKTYISNYLHNIQFLQEIGFSIAQPEE